MLGHRDAQPGRNIQSEISGEVGCAGWRGTRGMGEDEGSPCFYRDSMRGERDGGGNLI